MARAAVVRRKGVPVKLPYIESGTPTTVAEAVGLLAEHQGEASVLAGGQSLIPCRHFGWPERRCLSTVAADPHRREQEIKLSFPSDHTGPDWDSTQCLAAVVDGTARYRIVFPAIKATRPPHVLSCALPSCSATAT
jgi:hypothetical protein